MPSKQWKLCRMHFTEPLHLSSGKGENYLNSGSVLQSDALKSAVFSMAFHLWPERSPEEHQKCFEGFRLSSAFPYFGETLFFPKPMMRLPLHLEGVDISTDPAQSKMLKKLSFLGKKHFEDIINGRIIKASQSQIDASGRFLFDSEKGAHSFLRNELQQRLRMPEEEGGDPKPYFVDRVYFRSPDHSLGSGLFFLAEWDAGFDEKALEQMLKLLGDQGVGTDRSTGNGHFTAHWDTLHIELPEPFNAWLNLSLYCPTPEEMPAILAEGASYQLMKRGGYLASAADPRFRHFRRKSLYMFSEASVFPAILPLRGKMEDVKPDEAQLAHPVWRDGRAVFIPLRQIQDE